MSLTGGTRTSAAGNAGDANGNYSFRGSIDAGLGNLVANVTTNATATTATISAATVSLQEPVVFTVAQGTTPTGVDLSIASLIKSFNTTTNSLTKAGNGLMALTGADLADVTLMMADYNLTAVAVTDAASNLVGAISVDDLLEALVPEDWRNRVEASSGV